MASIKINDLPESVELDRVAMGAIYGGSSTPLLRDPSRRRERFKPDLLGLLIDRRRGRLTPR